MIEIFEQNANIVCLRVKGKLTHDDYKKVLIPLLEQVISKYGNSRVLFSMGEEFHGWEAAAMWDDAKFGLQHRMDFEKCAVVGGPKWVEWATKIASLIISGEVKTFPVNQLNEALNWIKAPVKAQVK